jgi:hypothetical protein
MATPTPEHLNAVRRILTEQIARPQLLYHALCNLERLRYEAAHRP